MAATAAGRELELEWVDSETIDRKRWTVCCLCCVKIG